MRWAWQRWLWAVALVAALGCQNAYREVVSIETLPVYQDAALLERAFALPVASRYLAAGLNYQQHMTFCGPTSAADVLGTLAGDHPDQEHVLENTGVGYWSVRFGGMTLDELGEVLRKRSGRQVTVLRNLDLAGFRKELREANGMGRRYVVNFHRGPLFGRGGGHHSPIGGYLEGEDLVLVLDVNEKFKPWLVPLERLFAAVDTIDAATQQKRGLLRME